VYTALDKESKARLESQAGWAFSLLDELSNYENSSPQMERASLI
jgi:hypothetical protein